MNHSLFIIRKAVIEDAMGIARVHVDSWRSTYATIFPQEYLNRLSYEKREKLWINNIPLGGVYVAENEVGEIIGFSSGGEERSGEYNGFDGELYAIYLIEKYQRKGVGSALFAAVTTELKQKGYQGMLVLVVEDNHSYRFYEVLGGEKIDSIEMSMAGEKYGEMVYGWRDITSLTLEINKCFTYR